MPNSDGRLTRISIVLIMAIIILLDLRWLLMSSVKIPFKIGGIDLAYIVGSAFLFGGALLLWHFSPEVTRILRRAGIRFRVLGKNEIEIFQALNVTAAKLMQGKSLIFESKSRARAMAVIRLTGRPRIPEVEISDEAYSNRLEYISTFYKLRDFFSGIQKRGIPCIYVVSLNPISTESKPIKSELRQLESDVKSLEDSKAPLGAKDEIMLGEKKSELKRLYLGSKVGFFQTEVLFFIWVDGDKNELDDLLNRLVGNVNSVLASIVAVFPEMETLQLKNVELLEAIGNFLCPFPVHQSPL